MYVVVKVSGVQVEVDTRVHMWCMGTVGNGEVETLRSKGVTDSASGRVYFK